MVKKLIVGLGNPGAEYDNTYHNVGRALLHVVAPELKAAGHDLVWKSHKDLFSYVTTGTLILVEPRTFMNDSGAAVREAVKKFGIAPEDIVVLHDESDLKIGTYKISVERNSAGHKGVQSIMDALHSKAFTRVRIGIRPAAELKRQKAEAFVLKKIGKKDEALLATLFDGIARDLIS